PPEPPPDPPISVAVPIPLFRPAALIVPDMVQVPVARMMSGVLVPLSVQVPVTVKFVYQCSPVRLPLHVDAPSRPSPKKRAAPPAEVNEADKLLPGINDVLDA